MFLNITTGSYIMSGRKSPGQQVISFILQELQNYTELSHPRFPTDEATKPIYDDIDTTDKCIIRGFAGLHLSPFSREQ